MEIKSKNNALEKNKKYKEKKKIKKQALKFNQKFVDQKEKILEQYETAKAQFLTKIKEKYQVKIESKPKIKSKSESQIKRKQKAFAEMCKYAKISRADDKGLVLQVDTGKITHRSECHGGHIYPKHNFPHLAFVYNNIRPISQIGNELQGDTVAKWIDKIPGSDIRRLTLKQQSEDKKQKSMVNDVNYYIEMYEHFKNQNDQHERRLSKKQNSH